jgi:predicted nucleic acid-binding protein
VNEIRKAEYIGLNLVVLGELLSGFKGGSKEEQNKKELNQFMDSPRVHFIELDKETAAFYAKIYWDLKKKGKPIPSNDMWVAASVMRHGFALFTFDEHFNYVENLEVKNVHL